jgi:hypothetical protein
MDARKGGGFLPFLHDSCSVLPRGRCPRTPAALCRRWALRATPVPTVRGWRNHFVVATMRIRRFGTGASAETLPGFAHAVSFASRTAGTGTLSIFGAAIPLKVELLVFLVCFVVVDWFHSHWNQRGTGTQVPASSTRSSRLRETAFAASYQSLSATSCAGSAHLFTNLRHLPSQFSRMPNSLALFTIRDRVTLGTTLLATS